MPKKRKMDEPEPVPVVAKPDGTPEKKEPLEVKPEGPQTKERISFAITQDGKIDYDAMRAETKKRFVEVVKNSPLPGMEIQKEPPFSPETLQVIWTGISIAEAKGIGELMLKAPKEISMTVFPYNEKQQETLSTALNKCLMKYEWLNSVKYKEEMDLLGMYFMMLTMKIAACLEMLRAQREAEKPAGEGQGAIQ